MPAKNKFDEPMSYQRSYSFLAPRRNPPGVEPLLRIGISVSGDFTLFALANLVEFLRHAADEMDYSRQRYCSWKILSHNRQPIRSSCGFEVVPTALYKDEERFDYVVILSGLLQSPTPVPNELYEFILELRRRDMPLIGLCAGQFRLAELGLLDGRKCAVHFIHEVAVKKLFPEVIPITTEPVVRDGAYITCPGGFATLHLAKWLVTEYCGVSRSHKVLHYWHTGGGFGDISERLADPGEPGMSCHDSRVRKAVALMHQESIEIVSVSEIAQRVGTTKRELTRLFNKHFNAPPAEYWRMLRLNSARWMIVNTDRSVAQIAYECGFTDSSHLTRWFKRSFGITPAGMRRIHSDLSVR